LCSEWRGAPDASSLLPRLVGTLRLWSSSETHSVRLVVAKIQYRDDQWRPMKLEDPGTYRLPPYWEEMFSSAVSIGS
jgi:hypothetical protein